MNSLPTDFVRYVPYAVFGMIAAGCWALLNWLASSKPRAAERLEEIRNPNLRRKRRMEEDGETKRADAVTRVLAKASPALAKPLQPKTELEVNKLKLKLMTAGFRGEAAPSIFLGTKLLGLMIGLMISGVTLIALQSFSQQAFMKAIAFGGVMFYIPEIILHFITKRRREEIFLGLPDALDLMVVCVEAGLGLDQAMRKVAEEMRSTYPIIADEFSLSNFQMQVGRSRADVLHELGVRSGVDDLRSLASILIQADKFGSSVAQALRVQSDSMRTRRKQLAEERAAKTAVKLIFPLVIFIFPGIFVVLVGPAAITMVREMFPMMQGAK
ncbi:MAG TPA: type II secretion system F family protein [Pirellulales bacterium]|nr:type II secretion system F family protein [Pirellulales bacterium]